MIAVIGRPAERQLGQIARADDKRTVFVGDVHEHLCALTRLGIFIGDIKGGLIVPDVGKMLPHGGGDVDLVQSCAGRLRQRAGVAERSAGRAEAGHGDGVDVAAGKAQHVIGAADHE